MADKADTLSASMGELDLGPEDLQNIIQANIDRGKEILGEIDQYISAVMANEQNDRVPHKVHYQTLKSDLKTELAALTRLKGTKPSKDQAVNTNLKYYEALWPACKRCSALVDFRKYVYWNQRKHGAHLGAKFTSPGERKGGRKFTKPGRIYGKKMSCTALVDIVAQGGHEWVRISTATEKKLLHELAKLGWQNDSDSDDEDKPDPSKSNWEDGDDDDEDEVFLVKNARDLARAARTNPIRGKPPTVRIVLTRIDSGKFKEIDAVLDKMRATGAIVQCAREIPETLPLETVLPSLLVHPSDASETLNIDCTILMALISDISHRDCPILDWYPSEVQMQIKEEKDEKLVPTHLYPAIGSHAMVTTEAAVSQMNHIVDTLATDAEKTRANILLGQNDRSNTSPDILLKEWQALSDHPVPAGLRLPIRIVACDVDEMLKTLPAVASSIAPELGALNGAIFFYGWSEHLTTLSANRTRARQIERMLGEIGLTDGEAPPHIWLCGGPRSLIAKSGRPGRSKHTVETFQAI